MRLFKDQVAIITGSSEGIGLSTAIQLAKEGASVVINGRDGDKLDHASKEMAKCKGAKFLVFQGDLTDPLVRHELVEATIRKFKKIEILVNNIGGGPDLHNIDDISDSEWEKTISFNLTTSFGMCRNVIPFMRSNGYGRIVNISSVAGRFRGRLSGPHYSAAKAGLLGMTRHLSYEFAKFGITVNAVAPGFVETERVMKKWLTHAPEDKAQIIQQIPLNRFARPEEIASAICFLASRETSYITGATLDVNGGFFMS